MTNATQNGKPYAGNPHVRFEVGGSRIGKPRRGSLLYNRICCIACLAATAVGIVGRASGTPFSGEDAYVRVTGSLPEIRIYGDRRVYIFTNTSEAAEIAVKTRLTLEEYLVVGGGGAGGHSIGGGGGGGGVVYSNEAQVVESGGTLSVSVGAGAFQHPGVPVKVSWRKKTGLVLMVW